ncbi:hypothetical protein LF1_49620 [Rubripirellula obstinata]|uniref:Uncharacterized protein n=1 Tax=Rubripirellula obstinata TaxID=406547 RepID=A0A5B1CN05_9BACT|nr:hypothetical protein LF1_49620 [Rubripirellula obstinata]
MPTRLNNLETRHGVGVSPRSDQARLNPGGISYVFNRSGTGKSVPKGNECLRPPLLNRIAGKHGRFIHEYRKLLLFAVLCWALRGYSRVLSVAEG